MKRKSFKIYFDQELDTDYDEEEVVTRIIYWIKKVQPRMDFSCHIDVLIFGNRNDGKDIPASVRPHPDDIKNR